jgi:cytochrome c-type biogenesis protein CcmH/NrfG
MLFGKIKQKNNTLKEAMRAYNWAEFLQPNLPQPLISQASILINSNKKNEACSLYKEAIEKGYNPKLIELNCDF